MTTSRKKGDLKLKAWTTTKDKVIYRWFESNAFLAAMHPEGSCESVSGSEFRRVFSQQLGTAQKMVSESNAIFTKYKYQAYSGGSWIKPPIMPVFVF